MMKIGVASETRIAFVVSADNKSAILEMRDGAWILSDFESGLYENIAQARVDWKEALKRALSRLEEMAR